MILNAFFLAFRQIKRNFLRAILTMLGVIIGVGAVIIMITLGNGTTQVITSQMSSLGSNLLLVFPGRDQSPGKGVRKKFMLEDANSLKLQMGNLVKAVAPISTSSVLVQFQKNNTQTQIHGINDDYFVATNWDLQYGRSFNREDYRAGSNVCIIGGSVSKNLFGDNVSVGSKIRLSNIVCEVVGVLESKGQGAMGNDQDDIVLLPLKTFHRSILKSDS